MELFFPLSPGERDEKFREEHSKSLRSSFLNVNDCEIKRGKTDLRGKIPGEIGLAEKRDGNSKETPGLHPRPFPGDTSSDSAGKKYISRKILLTKESFWCGNFKNHKTSRNCQFLYSVYVPLALLFILLFPIQVLREFRRGNRQSSAKAIHPSISVGTAVKKKK